MALEKLHYASPEIQKKFESEWYDWEAIKAKLEIIAKREEVDTKLTALDGNTEWYYNYLKELIDAEHAISNPLSDLSLDALKAKAEQWVEWAKELFAQKQEELITAGEEKFKKWIQESFLWKILPESLINWVTETGRKKVEWKLNGIGWSFQWWILWVIVWFIPGASILMKWYEKIFWGEQEEPTDSSNWDDSPENTPPETLAPWSDTSELLAEWNEKQRLNRERYGFSWKVFLREISWERFESDNNSDVVFTQLEWASFWDIQTAYNEYLKMKLNNSDDTQAYNALVSTLGINLGASVKKETVLATIESIAGIISTEIARDLLNKSILQSLSKDPNFRNTFWDEFADGIDNKEMNELSLGQLQICLAYMLPQHVQKLFESPSHKSAHLVESLFSENDILDQIQNTPLLSDNVAEAIITNASAPAMIYQEALFKGAVKFDELIWPQQKEIETLIDFKDIFLRKLSESKYTLWMPDFEAKLNEWLDYRNLIQIYVFLNGETNLESLSSFESWALYLWIMSTMKNAWPYEWRILESLSDDDTFTPMQKIFIAKHGSKISQSFLEQSLRVVSTWRDALKEVTKIKLSQATWIPEAEIPDWILDTAEILLISWLILWGFAVYKLPLPLHFKVILWGALHAWGFSAMASILYDMWTFDTVFNKMWDTEIRKQLDIILEQKFKMNLEEIIHSPEKPDFYS